MRAREPDRSGFVDRDGTDVAYELFEAAEGDTGRTIVFAPMDTIIHSHGWKAQVPYLARHAHGVTIDPRGNGRSGRPTDPAAYSDETNRDDLLAVMDELDIDSAVLMGICVSAWTAIITAAARPDRVRGLVLVGPWAPFLTPPHAFRAEYDFENDVPDAPGWAEVTRAYFRRDYRDFLEFFFGEMFPEPHSSKQWEDCVRWGLETMPEIMIAAHDSPMLCESVDDVHAVLGRVQCPTLIVHGDDDRCQPAERAVTLGDLLDAERLTITGAGHLPMAREPLAAKRAIGKFLDRIEPSHAAPREDHPCSAATGAAAAPAAVRFRSTGAVPVLPHRARPHLT